MERRIIFNSGGLKLEGLLNEAGDRGVVVAHPHPLYGGDMYNNVVDALCQAYDECGHSTLRFNFRGVGQSQGSYDNGDGEQDDLQAAIICLHDRGIREIDLAGYSFGSWVIARGIKGYGKIGRVIMVSPPVTSFDYSSFSDTPVLELVISGSEDNIADPATIEEALPLWNPNAVLRIIEGADHFYWGKTGEIKEIVMETLNLR